MAEVVIYTKSYCPYSEGCKQMLEEKKIHYDEKMIDSDSVLASEMEIKSGGRTDTPQVFVNSHHIGSFDDLKALESEGKLDELLNS